MQQWWKDKAKQIYEHIPDLGGFLVKADSEGQPGPQGYGRNHADGANMLAEVLAPAIRYVFEHMGVHRITAAYDPNNLRSARLLEHLGFRIEGLAKKYIELADGWHDSVLTALTR